MDSLVAGITRFGMQISLPPMAPCKKKKKIKMFLLFNKVIVTVAEACKIDLYK